MIKLPVKVADDDGTIEDANGRFLLLVAPRTGYVPAQVAAILNSHARLQAVARGAAKHRLDCGEWLPGEDFIEALERLQPGDLE